MSPKPVPTSSNVAPDGRLASDSRISTNAARSPPSQRLARMMSPIDRARTAGSMLGSSRISRPRRLAGVNTTPLEDSPLELRVTAAETQQRASVERLGAFDFRDEDQIVRRIAVRD